MSTRSDQENIDQLVKRAWGVQSTAKFALSLPDRATFLLLLDIRDNLDRLVMFHTGGVPAHHEGDHFRVLEEREQNAEQAKPTVADQSVSS